MAGVGVVAAGWRSRADPAGGRRTLGSAGGGQSRVLLRLAHDSNLRTVKKGEVLTVDQKGREPVGEGARYLGYGVMEASQTRGRGPEPASSYVPVSVRRSSSPFACASGKVAEARRTTSVSWRP